MDFSQFDKYIGDELFRHRVVQRISQQEMADLISEKMKQSGSKKGITRQAYSLYERGERSMPMQLFNYACDILGADRDKIFNTACEAFKR